MNPLQIIAGVVAGAVGAAVWAAIAYYANVEIGYVAWGIGILVGAAIAATGKRSPLAGVAAVLITIVAIAGGKYAVIEIAVQQMRAEMDLMAAQELGPEVEVTDVELQGFLAGKNATQREEAGEEISWPEVAEDEESVEAVYPADIWREAGEQFKQKTPDEKVALREEYLAAARELTANFGQAFVDAARKEGFAASFGIIDVIFFGLAVITAWGIASREE